jgi:hypothetical protein
MGDADRQIIRLLTEMRDAQQEEMAYRRKVLDESLALSRRAVRMQRIGLLFVVVVVAVGVALISAGLLARG